MLKPVLIFALFVLFAFPVSAEDFFFSIDGEDPYFGITLEPNQEVVFEAVLAPGIRVTDINVQTPNKLLQELLDESLAVFELTAGDKEKTLSEKTQFPSLLPAGFHDIIVEVRYYDAQQNLRTATQDFSITIPATNFASELSSMLTSYWDEETANEVVDIFTRRDLKRIPRALLDYELYNADLAAIGLSKEDIKNNKYEIKSVLSEAISTPSIEITGVDTSHIRNKPRQATISQVVDVFEIRNPVTKEVTYTSKIIIKLTNEKSLNNVEGIVEIPKTIAQDASFIVFSAPPTILVDDPIVKWNFQHIPAGQTKDYSVVVNQKIENINDIKIIAGGTEPSLKTRFIIWLVIGGWPIALLILVLLLFGGSGFTMYALKKKKLN